jgi:hypothetical protein
MKTISPSKIQLAYAHIMTNPGCNTREVAKIVDRPTTWVGSWLRRAESKGQVRAVVQGAGRRPTTWAVTNRPVKFNTGETVREKPAARKLTVQEFVREVERLSQQVEFDFN